MLLLLMASLPLRAQNPANTIVANLPNPTIIVNNRDEAAKQIGNIVTIKGKYAAFTLPNIKGMKRCAKIILADNSQILLETGKKAKRKKSEYKKMMGKEVSINGKMGEKIPLNLKGAPRLIGGFVLREVNIQMP